MAYPHPSSYSPSTRVDWKRGGGKRGSIKNEGVEIAGVEIVSPGGKDGKRGRNEYGKPKFPFSNIVV